jgi:hypothetical protein
MNIMNDLHAVGLNPFGVQLVAESMLRSPLAPMSVTQPLTLFFPVHRDDCKGWRGVKITLEAVPDEAQKPDGEADGEANG